jgi:KaiC/GvpD/RAD55 family RecA-like ATPase
MAKEYSTDIQRFFLEVMLHNAENFIRVQNIYNPENFDRSLQETARFLKTHSEEYSILPRYEQIKALTGADLKSIPEWDEGHSEWFLNEFESFTRRKELERAILKAADLLEDGDYDPVEKLIKDAVQISLTKDMGTDYFADPAGRLNKYFTAGGQVSTGWPQMDRLLYGGFSRGELNIFAGGSGSGKSLVMMNIALSWLQAGLNGVYITLELSEELTSLRTDAMLTSASTKDIRKNIDDTALKVSMHGKKFGKYQIKSLPAQSNINDIRAYIKEFQIKKGIRIDFVMVDYLDLLMPVSAKVNPNDLFVKDKYVSEELRNLAKELGVLFVTASQLNRSAVEEVEFDHSHISGGISKINTADNVFGIFTSRTMRERGKYQIQCMKSRSSTGVGQKIELEYNIDTMRITDEGGDTSGSSGNQVSSIMDRIKSGSAASHSGSGSGQTKDKWEKPQSKEGFDFTKKFAGTGGVPPKGEAQSTILKGMLAGLKSKD